MDQATIGLAADIVKAVRKVTGPGKIDLHRPFSNVGDAHNVADAAFEDPVGYGSIKLFEELVADACGVKHAVAVSSGTAALHLALLVLDIGPGSLVSVPTLTFAAPAAAVRYCGADITFDGFDDAAVDVHIAVDLLGRPDQRLVTGAYHRHGRAPIIEDAAEALGSRFNGKPCGSFGTIGIISFNNNKIVTTGGGGAVLTNDDDTAAKVRHLATTAKIPSPFHYEHDMVGFNYRLSNLAAAFGVGQMLALPSILQVKREIAAAYEAELLAAVFEVNFKRPLDGVRENHWLNAIMLEDVRQRDFVMAALQADGIGCRALFTPLHLQRPYEHWPFDTVAAAVAHDRWERTICLPSGRMPNWELQ